MKSVHGARVLVLVALGAASLPAFPQSCKTLADSDAQWSEHLEDLFLHSQLAETGDARSGEPLTCDHRVSDIGREDPWLFPRSSWTESDRMSTR